MNCELCGSTMGDQAAVCAACTRNLKHQLRQVYGDGRVHGLAHDLDLSTAKQSRFPRAPGHTSLGAAPLPLDPQASEAAWILRNTLTTWCRLMLERIPAPAAGPLCRRCSHGSCVAARAYTPPEDTLESMACWLCARTEWVRHAAWAAEAVDDITAAVAQARKAVDRPGERVYAGACPHCGHQVYDYPDRDPARCRHAGCDGQIHDPRKKRQDAARQAATQAPDTEVTAAEAALAAQAMGYRAGERWIRRLAAMGNLAPVDAGARPAKYRLGDVLSQLTPPKAKAG